MSMGKPKLGIRKRGDWQARALERFHAGKLTERDLAKLGIKPTAASAQKFVPAVAKVETESEIETKLRERFDAMNMLAYSTAIGENRALIVSGPAGVGKSHGVMEILGKLDKHIMATQIKGFVRPTGLYKTLYEFRHPNCVIVFDDADSIFDDVVSLNLLKAACDMTKKRTIHWLAETRMEDEDGERMPRNFDFEGSIIFITNTDFDENIARGNKLAPHFEALISRSHYLDLEIKSTMDYVIRIKQVVNECNMLGSQGFNKSQSDEIVNFIVEGREWLRELSLRMVIKVAGLYKSNPQNWKRLVRVTCAKKGA